MYVCICQNTAIFFGSILNICYIRYNYMFRPWMLAIVRLYMKTSSGYTDICELFIRGWGGDVGARSRSGQTRVRFFNICGSEHHAL